MSVTQVKQAIGSWNVRLRGNIPKSLLAFLEPFGHVAIVPGSVNVAELGDNILTAARYVGVFRNRANNSDGVVISGVGLEAWLGDENDAGDVFETPLEFTSATFATAIAAALPPGGAITAGIIHSIPGTFTGRFQWTTSRKALDYITSIYDAEWRLNNTGTLDAGTVADLYATTPKAILVTRDDSSDLRYRALPGEATMETNNDSYTTRVVVLAEGEGDTIQVGTADQPVIAYNDLHGNDVVVTRVFSESSTSGVNADTRAALLLNQYGSAQSPAIRLDTSTYDIKGNVAVGDYIYVYNPDSGFEDVANEETWRGEVIHPVKLRVVELSWPIRQGWTVAFRNNAGVWIDLSRYVFYEGGSTSIVVGDLPRSLTGGGVTEPIGSRPSIDTSIPDSPTFTSWSFGSYQGTDVSSTKSAVRVTWSTPLNTDGSTILDGAYYDIRYRVSEVLGYKVLWGQVASLRWGQLAGNRWGAPISQAISASPEWLYTQVGWGTNEVTILELTPGVIYEFQIRAVDSANPPHFGEFSASDFQTTTGDLFAPSVPAAPIVVGNLLSIQVTHRLGKASGGTFNLEPDLVRLSVHVGGSASFMPSDDNKVGDLNANIGMMQAGIPAIETFTIQPTETIHVKVVAIDRAGNKSSPSPSATVSATLIDDQHVSSLSVSKLTAGTITAETVLAAMMRVGTGGTVTIDQGTFIVNDGSGIPIVRMGLLPDGKYGIRVDDPLGNTQIRAGELISGGYGLEAVDETGALVSLSTLAFGMEARRGQGAVFLDTGGGAFYVPDNDLVIENVNIGSSRRALVILSSQIEHSLSSSAPAEVTRQGGMYVRIVNETTGAVTRSPGSLGVTASVGGNTNEVNIPTLPGGGMRSYAALVEGTGDFPTAPGKYRFEVWYSTTGEVYFQNRVITVMPF